MWPLGSCVGSLEQLQIAERRDHHPEMTDVMAKQWRTRGVVAEAFCNPPGGPRVQEGFTRAFFSPRDAGVRCAQLFALALYWAKGSKAPSWEKMDICSVPSLTSLGFFGEGPHLRSFGGAYPNPLECSYLHTRGWGNMHLFCQITPKDGRPGGFYPN